MKTIIYNYVPSLKSYSTANKAKIIAVVASAFSTAAKDHHILPCISIHMFNQINGHAFHNVGNSPREELSTTAEILSVICRILADAAMNNDIMTCRFNCDWYSDGCRSTRRDRQLEIPTPTDSFTFTFTVITRMTCHYDCE